MRVIFKITNKINNKIYIGKDSRNRKSYYGSGTLINFAIKKYGIENFDKEIIDTANTLEELNQKEIYWIDFYNSTSVNFGYNILPGGEGGNPYTDENMDRFRESLRRGQRNRFLNETKEDREKRISRVSGKKLSDETRKKISDRNKNRLISDEIKNRISESLKNYFETDEGISQIEKNRLMRIGSKQSDECKKKISLSMKGKTPKKLDVHPSSQYWYFYNHSNELIHESLGGYVDSLSKLKTNHRRIIKFDSPDDCLSYNLSKDKDFKVFREKYYKK